MNPLMVNHLAVVTFNVPPARNSKILMTEEDAFFYTAIL